MDQAFEKLADLQTLALYLGVLLLLVGISVLGLTGLVWLVMQWWRHKDREKLSLESVLLQVAVPRGNEIKIDAAEQMFAAFASVSKSGFKSNFQPYNHFSFEIVALKEDVRFYIHCHKDLRDLVEKQIHGAYPGADVKEVDEYNIFSENGKVAFAALKLKNSPHLPIKSFRELATDPLSSITASLAKMQEGEGAVVQILFWPADSKWSKGGKKYLSKTKSQEADPEKAKYEMDQRKLEAIESKVGKPGFATVIRLVVSSTSEAQAKAHLDNLKGAFTQFNGDQNGFSGEKIRFKGWLMMDFIYRFPPMLGTQSILSSEELATLYHFPNRTIETPNIHWLSSKRAPAPAQISRQGLYLGKSVYRGMSRPIHIDTDDRRRHMYIIGKTGTGKSEFLKDMILQDIKAGKGVCFIDPHDTVEKLLEHIPPERAEDVIYFDPSDTERPMGLNMLEARTEDEKHFVATSIIGLMYKLYDPHKTGIIGPRFEHAIRNAMLTVMSEPGNTFIEIVRVLTDQKYVQELLPKVKDPIVRRYWTDQIAQTADFHKSEVLDYIVSKFGRFVTNAMMRNIIGQSQSAFNIRQVMDEGKILLVNLAKGKIGEENSNFLGLIIVPKILLAAMSRQDMPEEQRRDFYLYVDEFQNFATPDFAVILSEARKYRLNLTVANQFIGQVEEDVKQAVFGNVGTLVSFRVGVSDANFLQHEFTPVFNETDLTNIERFNVYAKTIVENEPVQPFSMDMTRDLAKEKAEANPKVAQMILQLSRLKFGRDKQVIEEEIRQRSKL